MALQLPRIFYGTAQGVRASWASLFNLVNESPGLWHRYLEQLEFADVSLPESRIVVECSLTNYDPEPEKDHCRVYCFWTEWRHLKSGISRYYDVVQSQAYLKQSNPLWLALSLAKFDLRAAPFAVDAKALALTIGRSIVERLVWWLPELAMLKRFCVAGSGKFLVNYEECELFEASPLFWTEMFYLVSLVAGVRFDVLVSSYYRLYQCDITACLRGIGVIAPEGTRYRLTC